MSRPYFNIAVRVEALAGMPISSIAEDSVRFSNEFQCPVMLDVGNTEILIIPGDNPESVIKQHQNC